MTGSRVVWMNLEVCVDIVLHIILLYRLNQNLNQGGIENTKERKSYVNVNVNLIYSGHALTCTRSLALSIT